VRQVGYLQRLCRDIWSTEHKTLYKLDVQFERCGPNNVTFYKQCRLTMQAQKLNTNI